MAIETKENLPLDRSISPEILSDTEKSLSNVEKETRINFFKKAWNRIKNLFSSKEEQWQTKFLNNDIYWSAHIAYKCIILILPDFIYISSAFAPS